MERSSLLLALLLAITHLVQAQLPHKSLARQAVEKKVLGIDDLTYNGHTYQPRHPRVGGHPYFETADWTPGIVYRNGESLEMDELLFDLEINALVGKYFVPNRGPTAIVLHPHLVDSFQFAEHHFVNLQAIDTSLSPLFYEHIYTGRFTFLRQYKKMFINTYTTSQPRGKYSQLESVFWIYSEGELRQLKNERALVQFFASKKGAIKDYLKARKINYPKASSEELRQLLKFCDDENL